MKNSFLFLVLLSASLSAAEEYKNDERCLELSKEKNTIQVDE